MRFACASMDKKSSQDEGRKRKTGKVHIIETSISLSDLPTRIDGLRKYLMLFTMIVSHTKSYF